MVPRTIPQRDNSKQSGSQGCRRRHSQLPPRQARQSSHYVYAAPFGSICGRRAQCILRLSVRRNVCGARGAMLTSAAHAPELRRVNGNSLATKVRSPRRLRSKCPTKLVSSASKSMAKKPKTSRIRLLSRKSQRHQHFYALAKLHVIAALPRQTLTLNRAAHALANVEETSC